MRLSSACSFVFVISAACAPSEPVPQPRENTRSVAQAISGTCTNGEADGTFVEHCVLAGGSETRCSGGTAMCCRSCGDGEGCTTACFDRTEDVREEPKNLRPPHVLYMFYSADQVEEIKK
jgi:hypothetical protein